ncbi:hypothetical protein BJX70DRAFT_17962 [Aspergillus crustosus]
MSRQVSSCLSLLLWAFLSSMRIFYGLPHSPVDYMKRTKCCLADTTMGVICMVSTEVYPPLLEVASRGVMRHTTWLSLVACHVNRHLIHSFMAQWNSHLGYNRNPASDNQRKLTQYRKRESSAAGNQSRVPSTLARCTRCRHGTWLSLDTNSIGSLLGV